jgi:transcriptional regulator with PAS, ATPase and Fis domain
MLDVPLKEEGVLGRDVSQGIDINGLISDVVVHYIARAMEESGGSKSKAAEMLGLKNYQTLTNWMEKYGVN